METKHQEESPLRQFESEFKKQNSPPPPNSSPQNGFNAKQLKIFQIGLLAAVLMGIFPPWVDTFSVYANGTDVHSQGSAGYAFILDPPQALTWHTVNIDFGRLCIQWLVVGFAIGVGILNFKEPNKK
jgi:hypothetical protein